MRYWRHGRDTLFHISMYLLIHIFALPYLWYLPRAAVPLATGIYVSMLEYSLSEVQCMSVTQLPRLTSRFLSLSRAADGQGGGSGTALASGGLLLTTGGDDTRTRSSLGIEPPPVLHHTRLPPHSGPAAVKPQTTATGSSARQPNSQGASPLHASGQFTYSLCIHQCTLQTSMVMGKLLNRRSFLTFHNNKIILLRNYI